MMDFVIPTVIYIPSPTSSMAPVSDSSSSCSLFLSRWGDCSLTKSLAPPKQPRRNVKFNDSLPKLPQRSLPALIISSSSNESGSGVTTTKKVKKSQRRVRSLPRPATATPTSATTRQASSRSHQSSSASNANNASNIINSPQVLASLIVQRVHRETSKPYPRRNIFVARAA